ncbi:hypothetical protein U1Q18_002317 [Sarracenia purpurea var. burkii]
MSSMNAHSGFASSIIVELYQPRPTLEVIATKLDQPFGGEYQKESSIGLGNQAQKPQPIMFQNLEISKPNQVCSVGNPIRNGHLSSSFNLLAKGNLNLNQTIRPHLWCPLHRPSHCHLHIHRLRCPHDHASQRGQGLRYRQGHRGHVLGWPDLSHHRGPCHQRRFSPRDHCFTPGCGGEGHRRGGDDRPRAGKKREPRLDRDYTACDGGSNALAVVTGAVDVISVAKLAVGGGGGKGGVGREAVVEDERETMMVDKIEEDRVVRV